MLATRSLKALPRHKQDWLSPRRRLKTETAPAGANGDFQKEHGRQTKDFETKQWR